MERTIRVGVIGFGLAGQVFHTAVIDETPGLELACIVQRTGSSAAGALSTREDRADASKKCWTDTSIELCVVATPNDTHFRSCRAVPAGGPSRCGGQAGHAEQRGCGGFGRAGPRTATGVCAVP